MDTGNLSNSDVATLALLKDTAGTYPSSFAYDGSVLACKIDRNQDVFGMAVDRVVDNQKAGFDQIAATQARFGAENIEFRNSDRWASLDRLLFNQFNQIDRRFSDSQLEAHKCCCDLKAGQATIIAKLETQEAVRAAVESAMQTAKLDALLDRRTGPGNSGN